MERAYSNLERLAIAKSRLAYIKSECHQAVNPVSIRDRVRDLISLLEFVLCGEISDAQPNVVPGTPAGQLEDPTKTRVEFFGGPGNRGVQQELDPFGMPMPPTYHGPPSPHHAQQISPPTSRSLPSMPRPPVNSSDVHFIPAAGGGPVSGGGSSAGQTVEYYDGPGMPAVPGGRTPTSVEDSDLTRGGQRVELFGGPPQPAPTVSNMPPQIIPNQPTMTTEAGHPVAPTPPSPIRMPIPARTVPGAVPGTIPGALPPQPGSLIPGPPPGPIVPNPHDYTPPFRNGNGHGQNGQTIFPGYPPPGQPLPGVPRTMEEARTAIPIPLAE